MDAEDFLRSQHLYIDGEGNVHYMNPVSRLAELQVVMHSAMQQAELVERDINMADRTRVIESEIERLQAELYEIRQYGTDDYDEGTVLLFDMVFPTHPDTVFNYAAIKADNTWWVTGKQGRSNHTWGSLVSFWKDRVQNIHTVEQTKELFARNKKQAIEGDVLDHHDEGPTSYVTPPGGEFRKVQDNPQA